MTERWRTLNAPRDRLAEYNLGLPHQFRVHVGENTIQIECDAKGHGRSGKAHEERFAHAGRHVLRFMSHT
jgi:hypothetical protein